MFQQVCTNIHLTFYRLKVSISICISFHLSEGKHSVTMTFLPQCFIFGQFPMHLRKQFSHLFLSAFCIVDT